MYSRGLKSHYLHLIEKRFVTGVLHSCRNFFFYRQWEGYFQGHHPEDVVVSQSIFDSHNHKQLVKLTTTKYGQCNKRCSSLVQVLLAAKLSGFCLKWSISSNTYAYEAYCSYLHYNVRLPVLDAFVILLYPSSPLSHSPSLPLSLSPSSLSSHPIPCISSYMCMHLGYHCTDCLPDVHIVSARRACTDGLPDMYIVSVKWNWCLVSGHTSVKLNNL